MWARWKPPADVHPAEVEELVAVQTQADVNVGEADAQLTIVGIHTPTIVDTSSVIKGTGEDKNIRLEGTQAELDNLLAAGTQRSIAARSEVRPSEGCPDAPSKSVRHEARRGWSRVKRSASSVRHRDTQSRHKRHVIVVVAGRARGYRI